MLCFVKGVFRLFVVCTGKKFYRRKVFYLCVLTLGWGISETTDHPHVSPRGRGAVTESESGSDLRQFPRHRRLARTRGSLGRSAQPPLGVSCIKENGGPTDPRRPGTPSAKSLCSTLAGVLAYGGHFCSSLLWPPNLPCGEARVACGGRGPSCCPLAKKVRGIRGGVSVHGRSYPAFTTFAGAGETGGKGAAIFLLDHQPRPRVEPAVPRLERQLPRLASGLAVGSRGPPRLKPKAQVEVDFQGLHQLLHDLLEVERVERQDPVPPVVEELRTHCRQVQHLVVQMDDEQVVPSVRAGPRGPRRALPVRDESVCRVVERAWRATERPEVARRPRAPPPPPRR